MRHKRKASYVNFKELSEKDARQLSVEWQKNATFFEYKYMDYLKDNPNSTLENDIVLNKYFRLANSLWKKLVALDRHIKRNFN